MNPNKEVKRIEFETDSYKAVKFYNETNTPTMIKLVMKFSGGLVKSERQAVYVLLGFVVIAIAISLFLFFRDSTSQAPPARYRGNIPDLPEYKNPRTPQDFKLNSL